MQDNCLLNLRLRVKAFPALIVCLLACLITLPATSLMAQDNHRSRDVATDVNRPWEVLWGPDGYLWFTERPGRISRVHPDTRERSLILDITDRVSLTHEGGMLGMAIDPQFADSPYVYVAYAEYSELKQRDALFISRWKYDAAAQTLTDEELLLPPTSTFKLHQGCRLLVGPNRTLFVSVGDIGEQHRALDLGQFQGKIHRITLDGQIPADNPDPESSIWSIGHRNPQGLVFGPNGRLYSSEHGTDDDDEFNIIEKGGNCGWPAVLGKCDNGLEEVYCSQNDVIEPIYSWTPTIAPSGIEYYNHDLFPEWKNSILISTLKNQRIYRMELTAEGDEVVAEHQLFQGIWGRLRDFAISPEGRLFISATNMERDLPFPDRIFEVMPLSASRLTSVSEELEFDATSFPGINTQALQLPNADTDALIVHDVKIEGADARAFSVRVASAYQNIAAGATGAIEIDFTPLRVGGHTARLTFSSNAAEGADFTVELRGLGSEVEYTSRQRYVHVSAVPKDAENRMFVRLPLSDPLPNAAELTWESDNSDGFQVLSAAVEDNAILVAIRCIPGFEPVVSNLTFSADGEAVRSVSLVAELPQILWTDAQGMVLHNQAAAIDFSGKREFNRAHSLYIANTFTEERRIDGLDVSELNNNFAQISLDQAQLGLAADDFTEVKLQIDARAPGDNQFGLRLLQGQAEVISGRARLAIADWTPTNSNVILFESDVYPAVIDTVLVIEGASLTSGTGAELEFGGDQFSETVFVRGSLTEGDSLWIGLRAQLLNADSMRGSLKVQPDDNSVAFDIQLLANTTVSGVNPGLTAGKLSVSPVPATDEVTFSVGDVSPGAWTLKIYDMSGRLQLRSQGNSIATNLVITVPLAGDGVTTLAPGMYLAELRVAGRAFTTAFMRIQ